MATDFEYATDLGLAEKEIQAVQAAANPTVESVARTLGISLEEALPILDEIANVPATMAAPTAVAGVLSATITFVAPSNGGSPITAYEIVSSLGGVVFTSTSDLTSPITVTGLSAGAQTFTIKAVNDIGKGVASPASNSVTVTAS